MKKDLAKKIVTISIISIVLALVLTTIILALVPKKMENPIADGYASITVYKDSSSQQYKKYENPTTTAETNFAEVYNTIKNLHEESLKDNLLSAIFQGTGSFDSKVTSKYVSNVISSVAKADGNALVFTYLEEKTLMIGGEVYYNETSLNSTTITFDMIVMTLGTSDNFEECTIYLADRDDYKSSYQVSFLARQGELNDYINSLEFTAQ